MLGAHTLTASLIAANALSYPWATAALRLRKDPSMWVARLCAVTASLGFVVLAASSCSDPAQATPQAAFQATFSGSTCAATVSPGPTIGVGTATSASQATVADGTDGTSVSCRVTPIENGFSAYLTISRGSVAMTFDSDVVQGKTTTARSITLRGPNTAGAVYVPSVGSTCSVTWINGGEGRIWAAYNCGSMENGNSTTPAPCAAEGFVVAENCDQ